MTGVAPMTVASRRRDNLAPALLAAAALHVGLFAIAWLTQPKTLPPMGASVPIMLVASAPHSDSRAAEAAPETHAAATEAPVEKAPPPEPPPPAPEPARVRPAPKTPEKVAPPPPKPVKAAPKPPPKPAPRPRPEPPARAEAKPAPAKPAFSLDALQASIAKAARAAPNRPANARRGPTQAETAPQARVGAGQGVSQSDMAGLSQLLARLWNPNCDVEGGDAVVVPVKFQIGDDGRVVGKVTASGRENAADPIVAAAARRAVDAVRHAEPYAAPYRGQGVITVNFDAQKACSNR